MPKQLRVLSISYYGADLASGSAYSGALDRQRDYARLVAQFTVVVPGSTRALALAEGTLSIHTVPSRTPFHFFAHAYRHAVRLHKEHPFDVLMVDTPHLSGLLGVLLRARLKVPLIVHSMADMIDNPWYARERKQNVLKMVLMSIVCRCADVVRVSTHREVSRLEEYGIPRAKIAYVPFYIDHTLFQDALVRAGQVVREPHTFLYVGRLSPQKDVATLIRAMSHVVSHIKDARLRLVGGGAEEPYLRTLAAESDVGDTIDFCGPIPREDIAREFKRAGVFVLSSLYEGTCMVLHEAALAGLPIVSTDHAGALDFVTDGENGRLVHVRDHLGLAQALIELCTNRDTRERMGVCANERVKSVTREEAQKHVTALFDRFSAPQTFF